jgi:hypothetical protein
MRYLFLAEYICFTDWLITDVNFVLGLLLLVGVDSVADVLEVHADSIFRIDPEGGEVVCM